MGDTAARKQKHAPGVVVIHNDEIDLSSNEGRQLVTDVCRTAENLQSDDDLRRQYDISPQEWRDITEHKGLIKALREERNRRVRNGQAAREAAAKIHTRAPVILGEIMEDKGLSPRARIESAKQLHAVATATSTDSAGAANVGPMFQIRIDLGEGRVEEYIKSIKPVEPLTLENMPIREVE